MIFKNERSVALNFIKDTIALLANNKQIQLSIHRGVIDWASWNFQLYGRTLSIQTDFLDVSEGSLTLSFELLEPVGVNPNSGLAPVPQIDDEKLDVLISLILDSFRVIKSENAKLNKPAIESFSDIDVDLIEMHDAEKSIHGIVASGILVKLPVPDE